MKNQTELTQLLIQEYTKIWSNSAKMVDYCVEKTSGIVELNDGGLFCFEKPTIKTEFAVCYGLNGIASTQEMESARLESKAAKTKKYFFAENLLELNNLKKLLKSNEKFFLRVSYHSDDRPNTLLREIHACENFYRESTLGELSQQDRELILAELENQIAKFRRRLETYWKRYGSSKLRVDTYLVD